MSIYEQWLAKAFTKEGKSVDAVWDEYLPAEQKVYEYILSEKADKLKGTITELAEKFNMSVEYMVAFVDGINGILPTPYDVKELDENSSVEIDIDFEKLFKKMIEYKAEHLSELPQWDNIFTKEERNVFTKQQKMSRTVIKGEKIGRNDPCPCGSGKKYKKCCGANL